MLNIIFFQFYFDSLLLIFPNCLLLNLFPIVYFIISIFTFILFIFVIIMRRIRQLFIKIIFYLHLLFEEHQYIVLFISVLFLPLLITFLEFRFFFLIFIFKSLLFLILIFFIKIYIIYVVSKKSYILIYLNYTGVLLNENLLTIDI